MINNIFKLGRYPIFPLLRLYNFFYKEEDYVSKFEKLFLKKIPGKYSIAVNSATSGLHACLLALGVKEGDEVISPGLTVVMDAFVTMQVGATPIFADVDPLTHNISPKAILDCITKNTKAIIIVDWQGLPCDYDEILKISKKHKIPVICDSAQTINSKYKGEKCGEQFDFTVYSFEQKKHFTTGSEGGMVVTNDKNLAEKARKYAGIGYKHLTSEAGRTSLSKSEAQNPNYKRFEVLGFNYRMNQISAYLGILQLSRLEKLINNRIKIAKIFQNEMKNFKSFSFQNSTYSAKHTYYTFAMVYEGNSVTWEKIYNEYVKAGAESFYGAVKNPYLENPIYKKNVSWQKWEEGLCPNAEKIQKNLIAIKTNYESLRNAKSDARKLRQVCENLNIL